MEKIFALYDSDVFYTTRFMEYFQSKKESEFIISAFTRKDSLEEFLHSHTVEILLFSEQLTLEDINDLNIRYICRLTDNRIKAPDNGIPVVYKYQSARAVIEEVMTDYSAKENAVLAEHNPDQVKIMSVFSPIPSQEKIIFSWSISSLMSEQSKVLYVPLDLFPIQSPLNADKTSQSLTDFIYYLKENSNIAERMKLFSQTFRNLSVLSGVVHGADIISLSQEDMLNWVNELKTYSDFKMVVFYIGCYTEAMMELLKLSDTVLIPVLEDWYEAKVIKEWERQMRQVDGSVNPDKFQYIQLPREDNPGSLSTSINELSNYSSWECARQYLYCY